MSMDMPPDNLFAKVWLSLGRLDLMPTENQEHFVAVQFNRNISQSRNVLENAAILFITVNCYRKHSNWGSIHDTTVKIKLLDALNGIKHEYNNREKKTKIEHKPVGLDKEDHMFIVKWPGRETRIGWDERP